MATQLRRSPRLAAAREKGLVGAAAREKATAPRQLGYLRIERMLFSEAAPSFALLGISSVSMTLGNKWLMLRPELKAHTELVVVLQNSAAVCVAAGLVLVGAVQIRSISRRQLLYFAWDALVLAMQTFTSFRALQHLSVSATTVCRVLAIPTVAWLERLLLGTQLDAARHACGWLVVTGALIFAHEDLSFDTGSSAGYAWAAANLAAFVTNSVIDKMFMCSSDQSATGMALLTQLFSIPVTLAQYLLLRPDATPLTTAAGLLRGLDAASLAVLATTACLAALLGRCYARCYMVASATAVTIAGNINRGVAIVLSVPLFGARMTVTQVGGLLICVCGAFAFSLLGQWRGTGKRD